MLTSNPQLLVKYWKFSEDENGNETIELLSNSNQSLILKDHYVNVWKLIDGMRSVDDIITILCCHYSQSSQQEVYEAVNNCLKELEEKQLIITNWNPLG